MQTTKARMQQIIQEELKMLSEAAPVAGERGQLAGAGLARARTAPRRKSREEDIPLYKTKAYQDDPNISSIAKRGGGEAPVGKSDPLQAFSPWKSKPRARIAAASLRAAQARGAAGKAEEEGWTQTRSEDVDQPEGGPRTSKFKRRIATTVGDRPHRTETLTKSDGKETRTFKGKRSAAQPKWAAVRKAEQRASVRAGKDDPSLYKVYDPETRKHVGKAEREGTAATVVPHGRVGRKVQSAAQRLKYGGPGAREYEGSQVHDVESQYEVSREQRKGGEKPGYKSRIRDYSRQKTTPTLQFTDPGHEGTKRVMQTGGVDAYDPFQTVKQTGRASAKRDDHVAWDLSEGAQLNQIIQEELQAVLAGQSSPITGPQSITLVRGTSNMPTHSSETCNSRPCEEVHGSNWHNNPGIISDQEWETSI